MEDTRRLILGHAVDLVSEKGVRDVSFREVARRAGVSHQAPYHHFGNLPGILRAIAEEGFESLGRKLLQASRKSDPSEALTACGIAYVSFAVENVGHFRVMFSRGLVDLSDEENPIESSVDCFGVLLEVTERVWKEGHGRTMDSEGLAHVCWSTVHGLATLLTEGVIQRKSKREVKAEIKLVVEGLTALVKETK
ncbi:MAG: TetR/AcrR family transcriptional regulator [Myxococcota bacterium]